MLCLPRKVTLELHQILRLPRKMNLVIDPHHIWNVIYIARSNKSQPPTAANTAPATQKCLSWLILVTHMKRHLQCAEQQESSSNFTKYCACHDILTWRAQARNPWIASANITTMRNFYDLILFWFLGGTGGGLSSHTAARHTAGNPTFAATCSVGAWFAARCTFILFRMFFWWLSMINSCNFWVSSTIVENQTCDTWNQWVLGTKWFLYRLWHFCIMCHVTPTTPFGRCPARTKQQFWGCSHHPMLGIPVGFSFKTYVQTFRVFPQTTKDSSEQE